MRDEERSELYIQKLKGYHIVDPLRHSILMISFKSLPFEIITEISTYLKGKDLRVYVNLCKLTSLIKIDLILKIPSNVKKSDIVKYFSFLGSGTVRHFDSLRLINASKVIVTALGSSGIELRNLDLRNKDRLNDISFLSTLTSLTTLNLRGCSSISDISVLTSLTSLTKLNIRGCTGITNISLLGSLTSLTKLNMSRLFGMSDISFFPTLVNLVNLNLEYTWKLSDITPLVSLTSLKTLKIDKIGKLGENVKFGMSELSSMTNLVNLKLAAWCWSEGDNVDEMKPLLNIPNLNIICDKTYMNNRFPEGLREMFPRITIRTSS